MTDFEEYQPEDALYTWSILTQMLSGDWHMEMLRERLTEVYDRKLVDKLLPFSPDEHLDFGSV